jgi:hypothetical protein
VEKIVASEVVDELAAPAQEAKVLDPFDRAADKGIARALLLHVVVACPGRVGKKSPAVIPAWA